MIKTYQYIALAAIALGLAACSQEDDFIPQGNQKGAPIAIASAGVADLTTRATITTIEGTDYLTEGSIGVFVASTTDNANYKGTNLEWKYENSAWVVASGTKVVFEADGTKQTIGAYYPYSAELTGGKYYNIDLPGTYDENYEKLFKFLSKIPTIYATNAYLFMLFLSVFRSCMARYAPLKKEKTF